MTSQEVAGQPKDETHDRDGSENFSPKWQLVLRKTACLLHIFLGCVIFVPNEKKRNSKYSMY
jgi:hypothetical protein